MIIDVSTIIPAMAFILYVFFALFGFLQYSKARFYWSFQFYVLAMTVWSFGSFMMHLNSPVLTPLIWNKFMLVGMLSVPFTLIHSVVDIMELHKRNFKIFIKLSYTLVALLMYFNFSGTIVSNAGVTPDGQFFYELGHGAIVAYSINYVYIICTFLLLAFDSRKSNSLRARKSNSPKVRKNLLLPLFGTIIMLIGILFNLLPALGKYPIDILAAGINAILLFYTIYKFKLINYSKVALQVMLVLILSIAATFIYYLLILLIQVLNPAFAPYDIFPVATILGFATALIIAPLRNFMAYIVDKVIIPRRHPYQATIRELSQKLTTVIDLNELGDEVVVSLKHGLKADWTIFLVEDIKSKDNNLKLLSNNNCQTETKIGDTVYLEFNDQLQIKIDQLKSRDVSSLIYPEQREEAFKISEQLPSADIVIPLIYRKRISGYIISSFPENKNIISKYEIDALEILAAQCSLSLKNALSFEHIRAQGDELYLSNSKLEAIFNGIVSPIAMTDVDYTIIEVNNAATMFFGKIRENLIGKKCYRVFFNRTRPCPYCKSLDCIHGGGMTESEAEVNNEIYSFQFNNVRVPQNQKLVFIEIIKDITEQKRLQEDLVRTERMAGIGTLAAGIAHELNNPLAGIAGTAEIILSEVLDASPIKEYAEDILSYAMNAADVIKELAVYTRKEEKQLQEVDLVRILEFSLRLATRGIDSHEINVIRNYHALPHIKANESELQQLFLNLIVNAIQAMDGKGDLILSCNEENGSVYITVEDTGCGIPSENLNQIFTPFFTTKPPGTGTGLGLSNCYSLVEKMSGRFRVRSTVGEGSSFTVIFPITEAGKTAIRFNLITNDESGLNDVFFLQRKVLIGEKGYIEESIHRPFDEDAMHILAYRGIHPVGTVSLLPSSKFWPLPVSEYFNVEELLGKKNSAEIIRLAVLPEMRNTTVSIGLIMLVFLLARSIGIDKLVIDIFKDDTKTINLYKKFGFVEVGDYHSPAAVTVLVRHGKTTMEKDKDRLKRFIKPLYRKLITMFDFGEYTQDVIQEMEKIIPLNR
ncbi:MAG: GNAT family N-acetyltransferase [Bacteroidetes bacterium]|nr:GNAT family N-acetyltransferase [Bacteroidota bacterium]